RGADLSAGSQQLAAARCVAAEERRHRAAPLSRREGHAGLGPTDDGGECRQLHLGPCTSGTLSRATDRAAVRRKSTVDMVALAGGRSTSERAAARRAELPDRGAHE